MDLSVSHYIQLIVALFAGLLLFTATFIAPTKYFIPALILILPFQLITSRYGNLNMVLIYLIGFASLLKGEMRLRPLAGFISLIGMAYLLSLSQATSGTHISHIFYLISIGSNFIVFYLVYNFAIKANDPKHIINIYIWLSALTTLYFLFSLLIGFKHIAILGIEELSFGQNLERQQRLIGPFGAAGINSEYLALQIIFLLFVFMRESAKLKRIAVLCLMIASFAFLVATGSRGGFVALVLGVILYLLLYRKEIGIKGLLGLGLIGGGFVAAAMIIITFTDFSILFERLESTEIKGYEIDTRVGLLDPTLEAISERPILGHGPKMKIYSDIQSWKNAPYPHNLYLFLPYTIGFFGLFAYLIFFIFLLIRFYNKRSPEQRDEAYYGISTLAIILLIMFLASQYRIEFLRAGFVNYQHCVFAFWGALLALANLAKTNTQKSATGTTK